MEECEICGARAKDIYIVNVEEAELRVCTRCTKGKKIVSKVIERPARGAQQKARAPEDAANVVENYGALIRDARESMRIPIKVLAERINEKETLLLRIEQQKTVPDAKLSKKLERALGIKLSDSQQQGETGNYTGRGEEPTIGEFIKKA